MKRLSNILIVLFVLIGTLGAQQLNADRVRRSIEQLERKIEQVSALAEKYHDARAVKLVNDAKSELNLAFEKYQEYKNTPEGQFAKRRLLINLAKAHFKLADKYIGAASRFLLFKPAAQKKNELDNLIRRAQDASIHSASDESRYFLNKARRFQAEAQSAFRNERFLRGYEYLRVAMYFAQKTIDMSGTLGNGRSNEQEFQNARQNVQTLIRRAGDLIDQNSLSVQMYKNAEAYFNRAQTAYRSGKLKEAFNQLKLAERLLYRVVDMSSSGHSVSVEQQARDNAQSLGRYLQSLRDDFQNENNPFLKKADNLYRRANNQIQSGKYRQALVSIQLSQRMALKAYHQNTRSANEMDITDIEARFRDARQLFDMQGSAKAGSQSLHKQAGRYLDDTAEAMRDKNYSRARYLLNIAIKLMNRARHTPVSNLDKQQIDQKLRRLSDIISRLQKNESLGENWQIHADILKDLLKQAQQALSAGDKSTADVLAGFIQSQLTALLKRN